MYHGKFQKVLSVENLMCSVFSVLCLVINSDFQEMHLEGIGGAQVEAFI